MLVDEIMMLGLARGFACLFYACLAGEKTCLLHPYRKRQWQYETMMGVLIVRQESSLQEGIFGSKWDDRFLPPSFLRL